jgi:hypothetical protein
MPAPPRARQFAAAYLSPPWLAHRGSYAIAMARLARGDGAILH